MLTDQQVELLKTVRKNIASEQIGYDQSIWIKNRMQMDGWVDVFCGITVGDLGIVLAAPDCGTTCCFAGHITYAACKADPSLLRTYDANTINGMALELFPVPYRSMLANAFHHNFGRRQFLKHGETQNEFAKSNVLGVLDLMIAGVDPVEIDNKLDYAGFYPEFEHLLPTE